ncbi:MAG: putative porin [Acidobacteriota bacterium]
MCSIILAIVAVAPPASAQVPATDVQRILDQLADQQKVILALQAQLMEQQKRLDQIQGVNQAATPAVVVVAATPAQGGPQPAAASSSVTALAPRVDALAKTVDALDANLRGFRFSGDFRYRLDIQLRSGNTFAAPLQNSRSRYRLRLNVDKEIMAGLTTHLQMSSGPYNNEITNDNDFAGLATKHAFGLSEAWVRYANKGFSIRGGRMEEVFADNSRFLWDDDLRLNGFDARYNRKLNKSTDLEFRAGEYILTNPNTPIVAAGSPLLSIGYRLGQKVRDATLFHPGFVLRQKADKWTQQLTGTFSWYKEANQINLGSTAAGVALIAGNNLGLTLSGPLGGAGNAVVASGSPILAARHYQVAHLGYRADYASFKAGGVALPFWAEFQTAENVGTSKDRLAYVATVNFGNIRKQGDMRFLYAYSYKQANSIVSQFTDDDLGTGTGVNTRVNHMRMDLGLTRFVQLQNLFFIQDPIAANRPGFFVSIPKGAKTTFRYQGQLAFTF